MRLTRLDLERYGPFTGTQLNLRPDAALHVIYGANEAGKSSALNAVTDLLYGFKTTSTANFRHHYGDLLIGARMLRADGGASELRRRKRNKNSLTGPDDQPLDEALLDPMLGGISREVFLAAFGLSQGGLREGARQMLAASGEVGESLFAAASGLKTLIGVREELDRDAAALFKPRSSKTALSEAQARYDDAREALRRHSLRADDVKALEDRIVAEEERGAEITRRLRQAGERRARIDRVRRVAPILARIARHEEELATLREPGALPPDFAARIERALDDARTGRETLAGLAQALTQARQGLEAIALDEGILAEADAVVALNDERASLAKALLDLPRRLEETRLLTTALDDLAHRLGLADREALKRMQPNEPMLERIRGLIDKRRAAEIRLASNEDATRRARNTIDDLTRQMNGRADTADPEPLRARLQAMRPRLAEAETLAEREADLARARLRFEERLARLTPAVSEQQVLWSWREPEDAVLAGFERRFAAFETGLRQDEEQTTRLKADLASQDQAIAALAAADELVDETRLAEVRDRRDELFGHVLETPGAVSVNAYRIAVAQADDLADRRLGQIERLAQRDMALRARRENAGRLEELTGILAARREEERAALADWRALFAPLGCNAGPPAAMRSFLGDIRQLREMRETLADLEMQAERIRLRLAEERPALEAIAAQAGLDGLAVQSLPSLMRLVEDRLGQLDRGAREIRTLEDRLSTAKAELARSMDESRQTADVLSAMQDEWTQIAGAIGLAGRAGVQEVAKACELWAGVQGKLTQLESLDHRIDSISQDRDAFRLKVQALAPRLLPDATGEPAELAAALMTKLTQAREAAGRRREAGAAVSRQQAALEQAEARQQDHDRLVLSLAQQAGCEPAELASLAAELNTRHVLQGALRLAREELLGQGDGLDAAVLGAEVAEIGADRAAGESEAVQAELAALVEQDKQAALALGDLRRQRMILEKEAGAAGAAQQLEDARGDLERIARDYIVAKTASMLIDAGLERQLRTEQGPLITAAGNLFAAITEKAFTGIVTLYDEDELRLAAKRGDGEVVAIEGLSEGTRDQLYLALRLANLEAMAARREVPPFIGDDLVITFDERRVAATLSALAIEGSGLQKILFTHHRHVVEIAQDRLGEAVDIVALER